MDSSLCFLVKKSLGCARTFAVFAWVDFVRALRFLFSTYCRDIFLSALLSALFLMASGLFLGAIGIDDEFNALSSVFDGTGRGLWAQHLLTILLPGQSGITFVPVFIGCALYAASITVVIGLWGGIRKDIACLSAALMGCFPYFASMMTFDVAQVAYPLGFLLISASLIPVFNDLKWPFVGFSIVSFALSFAFYQGVATTFGAAWASVIGMRYFLSKDKRQFFSSALSTFIPRSLMVLVFGSLIYMLTVKVSQLLIPHVQWGGSYGVSANLLFLDSYRLETALFNVRGLLLGATGDLPAFSAHLYLIGVIFAGLLILREKSLRWPVKLSVALFFLASLFILPFWILLVQSMPLAPRSTVGLGILYGYVFAVLAVRASRHFRFLLIGLATIVVTQFIFLGNEMYYSQFLASQADQVVVTRIAARIDSFAKDNDLSYPVRVTIVGRYAPAARQYAKYDTIGSSPLDWDSGNIHRQASLFSLYGVDGIVIDRDPKIRSEIIDYIESSKLPSWPDPNSVFLYKGSLVVVSLGGLR